MTLDLLNAQQYKRKKQRRQQQAAEHARLCALLKATTAELGLVRAQHKLHSDFVAQRLPP